MQAEGFMEDAVERYLNRATAQHGDPELAKDEIQSVLAIWRDITESMNHGPTHNLLYAVTEGVYV